MHRVLLTIVTVLVVAELVVLCVAYNEGFTIDEYNVWQETIIKTAITSLVAAGIGWLAEKLTSWVRERLFNHNTTGEYHEEM